MTGNADLCPKGEVSFIVYLYPLHLEWVLLLCEADIRTILS